MWYALPDRRYDQNDDITAQRFNEVLNVSSGQSESADQEDSSDKGTIFNPCNR